MKKIFFLAILFCLSLVSAKWTNAEMNVQIEWDVTSDKLLETADIEVFIPSNSTNQKVISMNFSEEAELLFNGSIWKAKFHLENITNKKIVGDFHILTDYLNRTRMDDTHQSYLEFSQLADVNNEIRKASKVSESFPYDIINLTSWVHNIVIYDESYGKINMSATWTIENKRGTCDEYAHLLTSLLRSRGVSARIITGFVKDENEWIPHAWVETYNQRFGWIEVDPTHDEFLNLNPLRVRTGTGIDQSEITDKISAISLEDASIKLDSTVDITILNKNEEADISIEINIPEQANLSQVQPVQIIVKNGNYPKYTTTSLLLPKEVKCDNCDVPLFLSPGEEKELEFTLNLPKLSPNVRYTFPVVVLTDYEKIDSAFNRLSIEQPSYIGMENLPLSFRMFIGVVVVAAIALIIAIVLIKR